MRGHALLYTTAVGTLCGLTIIIMSATSFIHRTDCLFILAILSQIDGSLAEMLTARQYVTEANGRLVLSVHVAGPARLKTRSAILPQSSHESNTMLGKRDTNQSHTV